jgi:arylsulfatase
MFMPLTGQSPWNHGMLSAASQARRQARGWLADTGHELLERSVPLFRRGFVCFAGERDLPPVVNSPPGGWDERFRGDKACGSSFPDAWCGEMPPDATLLSRRAYRASIQFVDEQVGYIFEALEETGMLNSTMVVWTADHGDGQGDHYHWRKGYPYELSSHVPMLLRLPESLDGGAMTRGRSLSHVTELRDIFPTMVDAAGITGSCADTDVDGASLLCLLGDPTWASCGRSAAGWRKWIGLEHDTCYNMTNHWSALTDGKFKYVFQAWNASEQLFNLTADPGERQDLAGKDTVTLERWRERLVAQFEQEKRGEGWVRSGRLVRRTTSQLYSPHYPGHSPH